MPTWEVIALKKTCFKRLSGIAFEFGCSSKDSFDQSPSDSVWMCTTRLCDYFTLLHQTFKQGHYIQTRDISRCLTHAQRTLLRIGNGRRSSARLGNSAHQMQSLLQVSSRSSARRRVSSQKKNTRKGS